MQETGSQKQDDSKKAQAQEEVADSAAAKDNDDYEAAIAERDARIGELEAQIAEAAKSVESVEALMAQIEDLKAESAKERTDYELRLAGCRNAKAARALLEDHKGVIAVSGLGNYTHNVGYKTGSITYEFETKTFTTTAGFAF